MIQPLNETHRRLRFEGRPLYDHRNLVVAPRSLPTVTRTEGRHHDSVSELSVLGRERDEMVTCV